MTVLAAIALGGLYATGTVALAVAFRLGAAERAPSFAVKQLTGQSLLLLGSAAVEEFVFRVLLLGVLGVVMPDALAVAVSSVLFGLPHVVRGNRGEERVANAITASAFGAVVGAMWIGSHNFAAITAFHAAFNITAGLVLGGAGTDPLTPRLPVVTWPLRLRTLDVLRGTRLVVLTALSELIPLAVVAVLLVL